LNFENLRMILIPGSGSFRHGTETELLRNGSTKIKTSYRFHACIKLVLIPVIKNRRRFIQIFPDYRSDDSRPPISLIPSCLNSNMSSGFWLANLISHTQFFYSMCFVAMQHKPMLKFLIPFIKLEFVIP
jgi:hypothetical protein